jgi:ABC-2 type transport system permease protein
MSSIDDNSLVATAPREPFGRRVADVWRYRELLRNLVVRDIKVRYKRSVLGFAWMMLNPLIAMIVFSIIFREIFKMERAYPLYVISALLFYNFFSLGSAQGLNSILNASGLIRKVSVPKAIFPLASVLANLVNFGLSLVPLAVVMAFTSTEVSPALLTLPIAVAAIFLFTYGLSLVLATLNVFYRDVRWFYDSVLLILFYMTPIIYPATVVPEEFRFILDWNPLTWLLDLFRAPIYEGRVPDAAEFAAGIGIAVGTFVLGWVVFHKYEDQFINYV